MKMMKDGRTRSLFLAIVRSETRAVYDYTFCSCPPFWINDVIDVFLLLHGGPTMRNEKTVDSEVLSSIDWFY